MAIKPDKNTGTPWSIKAATIGFGAATVFQPSSYSIAQPMTTSTHSGPTAGGVNYVDERLLDARLKESEARLELRFSDRLAKISDQISALAGTVDRIDNKYDTLSTKLDHKAGIGTVWAAAASAVVTGLLAVLAIITWGNDKEQTGIAIASSPVLQRQIKPSEATENAPAPVVAISTNATRAASPPKAHD